MFKNAAYLIKCDMPGKKKLALLMEEMPIESFKKTWIGVLFVGSQCHRW